MLIADAGANSDPSSMALQVAPEDLLAAAESFEAAAIKAQNWLNENTQDLTIKAAGADVISTNVASWLSDNAIGLMGAVPAVQKAVHALLSVAGEMRATATAYRVTEGSVATALAQVGKSA